MDIIDMQIVSSNLVMESSTKMIFVDGGFCKNPIYMNLLAAAYPTKEVYSTHVAQATAMGAALAIHEHWNNTALTTEKIIQLKRY
jgi:sugar (pentulose or hexulose) kinase